MHLWADSTGSPAAGNPTTYPLAKDFNRGDYKVDKSLRK